MMYQKSFRIMLMLAIVSIFLLPKFQALAQEDYPNRPIEVTIPTAPGTATDLAVRLLSDKWAEFLGQPVFVTNKPGAAGVIGAKYVATAKPDGYKLLSFGTGHLTASRLLRKDVGYDLDSFTMLFAHSKLGLFFSVRPDSRWKTLKEFFEEAKKNPGKLKYAAIGQGSFQHVATELLSKVAGVKLTLVPFGSTPENLTALMGGNVDLAVSFGLPGLGKSELVRPLAISDFERLPDYPNIPTIGELGYHIDYGITYNSVAAPSKTPKKIISKFVEAHKKVWAKYKKELEDKMPPTGQYAIYADGEKLLEHLKQNEEILKHFFTEFGIKPE